MTDRPLLVILTETYPYPGPDDAFLMSEVTALCDQARVVLVPTRMQGVIPQEIPGHPEVDVSLAKELSRLSRADDVRSLLSSGTVHELSRHGGAALHPRAVATVARRQARAAIARRWTERHLLPMVRGGRSIVYSWWGTAAAAGVSRALVGSGVPFVCRMHGYDLYAEQESIGFVPFQSDIMRNATKVWTAARAGADYLHAAYPAARVPIVVRPVGSLEVHAAARQISPGPRQVVSCSSVIPVKRVDLLARALSELCVRHPDLDVEWTHIGSGALLPEVRALSDSLPGLRGRATFTGGLPHVGVLEWLGSHRVDAFCNVSSSEGLPVTLMEAASAGIPLLALDVGGNAEVVDDANGRLLPADASPGQIAAALAELLTAAPDEVEAMRRASRTRWEENFDARRNYADFGQRLVALAASAVDPIP